MTDTGLKVRAELDEYKYARAIVRRQPVVTHSTATATTPSLRAGLNLAADQLSQLFMSRPLRVLNLIRKNAKGMTPGEFKSFFYSGLVVL
jgi:hypothetical protein